MDCDRCGEEIEGFRVLMTREEVEEAGGEIEEGYEDREEFPVGTAGYYRTTEGSQWAEYADEDEEYLCDACMVTDPDYQNDYPEANANS